MEKVSYTITAKTQDEFSSIEAKIKSLPNEILEQIDNVSNHGSFFTKVLMKSQFNNTMIVNVCADELVGVTISKSEVTIQNKGFVFTYVRSENNEDLKINYLTNPFKQKKDGNKKTRLLKRISTCR